MKISKRGAALAAIVDDAAAKGVAGGDLAVLRSLSNSSSISIEEFQKLADLSVDCLPLWQRRYPPRVIHSLSRSGCCSAHQQLVRSREMNFVTQDCIKCFRKARTLRLSDIPPVACPQCSSIVTVRYVGRNYGFKCACGCIFELGSILPHWEDEGFQYCGVAVPSDEQK